MSLDLQDITKRFSGTVAVDHLSLSIPKGEMFGLLGANGAGKTTTIRMILGLLQPNEGTISWNGKPLTYKQSQQIGYLPEERGLYPKLTVKEQLIYLGRLKGMSKSDILKQLEYWLDRLKVPENANKKVEELSKGNQQKIQFLAAILHKPELLFLDEPFSGLDPVNVEQLKDAVIELAKQGTTIIFSSHRMEHVEELCENLCILRKGQAVVKGNLREIKRSYRQRTITVHTEATLTGLEDFDGVNNVKQNAQGYTLEIADEQVAQKLLPYIANQGLITRFALAEPSLHQIFIDKVGAAYE